MKRKITVVITLLLIAAALLLYSKYQNEISDLMLPGISADSNIALVTAYSEDNPGLAYDIKGYFKDGGFIFFLPVRCDASRLVFYALDEDGKRLDKFVHDFYAENFMTVGEVTVTAMISKIPSLEIRLSKGSLLEVEESEDHSIYAFGDMTMSASDEEVISKGYEGVMHSRNGKRGSAGTMSLRGHGNISWEAEKKSYNIYAENDMSLLGMRSTDKWVLLANADDYSLLRNEVFLELSQKLLGRYAPQFRQVDLFIDGEYRGLYLLTQKVEISKASVDIIKGRDVLYRWGMLGEDKYKLDMSRNLFRDELTNVVEVMDSQGSSEDYDRAQSFIASISDEGDGYLQLMDTDSFARYYWIQEFAKNTDATSRSFYTVWKYDDNKMYAEPVWDMDRTAGVVEPFARPVDYIYPTGWAVRQEEWFVPLFEKESFVKEVQRVYEENHLAAVFDECAEGVSAKAEYIRASANMNFTRWDILSKEQNNQIVRYMGESTFDTQVQWLMEWLRQRSEWILENLDL